MTAELFLCDFLNCSRQELQSHVIMNPSKVIRAMEKYAQIYHQQSLKNSENVEQQTDKLKDAVFNNVSDIDSHS